ncbi:hypothetical protein AGR8A_Cc70200 [Agrobacterium fabrum str. J-07]|nr:hypothetical protein AGR8A_Cc70200 [Agrobacterium fabrum str. J-07]
MSSNMTAMADPSRPWRFYFAPCLG